MPSDIKNLQHIIGHDFNDEQLLRIALTHSSTGHKKNYERLEFLGDRVLGLVIASLLFRKFPDEKEGDMAKRLSALVQGTTLAVIATQVNLSDYIILSESEAAAGGAENEHILADVLEAVLGALYLDGGLKSCEKFIETQWKDTFFTMKRPPQHPKTAIQEWAQGKGLPLPEYEVAGQSGPDHAPVFEIKLIVKGHPPILAQGKSRAEAEKNAAESFMSGVDK